MNIADYDTEKTLHFTKEQIRSMENHAGHPKGLLQKTNEKVSEISRIH